MLKGGLRPWSQTMVSEGARPWGRGRSGDCEKGVVGSGRENLRRVFCIIRKPVCTSATPFCTSAICFPLPGPQRPFAPSPNHFWEFTIFGPSPRTCVLQPYCNFVKFLAACPGIPGKHFETLQKITHLVCCCGHAFSTSHFRSGKRGHYEKGLFTGEISRTSKISKLSRISRRWPESPLFSTVWGFSKSSRISKFSRISRKMGFSEKTSLPQDPFFRTRHIPSGIWLSQRGCKILLTLDVLNRNLRFATIRIATGSQRFQIARFESQG